MNTKQKSYKYITDTCILFFERHGSECLKTIAYFGRSRGSDSLAFDQRHGKALARSLRQWAPAILSSYQDADEAAEVKRMLEIHVDRLDSFSKTTEGESAVLCVSGCGGGVLGW